jgi:hypothetical protein
MQIRWIHSLFMRRAQAARLLVAYFHGVSAQGRGDHFAASVFPNRGCSTQVIYVGVSNQQSDNWRVAQVSSSGAKQFLCMGSRAGVDENHSLIAADRVNVAIR